MNVNMVKDALPFITPVVCGLILAVLVAVGRRVTHIWDAQADQKTALNSSKVTIETNRIAAETALKVVEGGVVEVKQDLRTLAATVGEHGKVLYEIRGMLSPKPQPPKG